MAENIKNPAKCSTAEIASEAGASDVVRLFSCAAWLNLDAVNLVTLGVSRRDTWVRLLPGETFKDSSVRLGDQAVKLCANCNRFEPRPDVG